MRLAKSSIRRGESFFSQKHAARLAKAWQLVKLG
jgi:hypothetical protein